MRLLHAAVKANIVYNILLVFVSIAFVVQTQQVYTCLFCFSSWSLLFFPTATLKVDAIPKFPTFPIPFFCYGHIELYFV